MLILFFACSIGETSLKSPQEQEIVHLLQQIEENAVEIEAAAVELESFIDQARRNVQNGSTAKEQKQELQKRLWHLKEKGKQLKEQKKNIQQAIQVKTVP